MKNFLISTPSAALSYDSKIVHGHILLHYHYWDYLHNTINHEQFIVYYDFLQKLVVEENSVHIKIDYFWQIPYSTLQFSTEIT